VQLLIKSFVYTFLHAVKTGAKQKIFQFKNYSLHHVQSIVFVYYNKND